MAIMLKSFLPSLALYASLANALPNAAKAAGAIPAASAAYNLIETYDSSNWFNKFNVQNITDPTAGFVTYVNDAYAKSSGLYQIRGNQVYIGVDSTSHLNPNGPGRNSVRLQSNNAYNHGLVIANFAHIPGSNCGAWPAFWMFGPNWPNSGEIDIIEGVNLNTYNQVTLHTAPGCSPGVGSAGETGARVNYADCGAGGGYNGCGVVSPDATSYGTAFNANNGGVYATLWSSSAIQVWYFPTNRIPSDINSGTPNPAGWGKPTANFAGCAFDNYFKNMNIIFDTTFCGSWAGADAWTQSSCSKIDASCNSYVANQPQSFADTYWLINNIKIYSV